MLKIGLPITIKSLGLLIKLFKYKKVAKMATINNVQNTWFNEKNAIKKLARNLVNSMKKITVITIETVKHYDLGTVSSLLLKLVV